MLVDVHFHPFIAEMAPDTSAVMARAREAGVIAAVAAGLDATTNELVLEMAGRVPGLAPAVGFHPWFLEPAPDLEVLERVAVNPRVVAIGEIGLDGKHETPMEVQERWFRDQMALASNFGLPVVVHAQNAVARVEAILCEFPDVRGVMHSFPGGPDIAKRLVDRGFCVSFSGAVTRPRAKGAHRVARALPLDGILVETDAPAIGMDGVPPEEVEPRHAVLVAAALAALQEVDVREIEAATVENTRRVFGPRLDQYLGGIHG